MIQEMGIDDQGGSLLVNIEVIKNIWTNQYLILTRYQQNIECRRRIHIDSVKPGKIHFYIIVKWLRIVPFPVSGVQLEIVDHHRCAQERYRAQEYFKACLHDRVVLSGA